MKLYFETEVLGKLSDIKKGFNQDLFLKLKPPFMALQLDRFDGCEVGNEVHLRLGLGWPAQKWVSLITEAHEKDKEWLFVDEGKLLPFPLKKWRHEHRVIQKTDSTCVISDSIQFQGTNSLLERLIWAPLWLSFSYRPKVYLQIFGDPQKL